MKSISPNPKKHKTWREFKEDNILMNFTVMLVPHKSYKKPIHFNIPVGMIVGAFMSLFVLLCFTSYFAYSSFKLQYVAVENARLDKISAQQELQLKDLEIMADEVLEKLNSIKDSESEVRSKVGLGPMREPAVGGVDEQYFLSGDAQELSDSMYGDSELSERLSGLHSMLSSLNSYADYGTDRMFELEGEVKNRLDYLASIPSGQPIFKGEVTSEFGGRVNPFSLSSVESHTGLDVGADYGAPVYAAGRGTVITAEYLAGYGNIVRIDHGYGFISIYAHCSELVAEIGDEVKRGDLICFVGSTGRSTGNHLHFGISYNGSWIDPRSIMDKNGTL
ncbi:MAG: M23 family metallopeptidase [Oscillospiraceae bacterium]